MFKTGIASLPLHGGKAPRWLFNRMVKLGRAILEVIAEEYGLREILVRLSDPCWFQAFGCALGFDWHSSGLTTVTCGALKEALKDGTLDLILCGGKGKVSLRTPDEIVKACDILGIGSSRERKLIHASRLVAKIDNAVLQDGYQLYHHVIVFDKDGNWVVIQQGMDAEYGTARRYHWLSFNVEKGFFDSPHSGIISDLKRSAVLNMASTLSEEARKVSVDIVKDGPVKVKKLYLEVQSLREDTLLKWIPGLKRKLVNVRELKYLEMPRNINWNALREAYEISPSNYEELILVKGLGPSTIRALALISELIYGTPIDWADPVKYSFAVGGKDGVPFPVKRDVMDEVTRMLMEAIESARIGERDKLKALRRLRSFAPPTLI